MVPEPNDQMSHRRHSVVFDDATGLATHLETEEMPDLCVDHPSELNCLPCFDTYGRQTCHHRDHGDFCPFDGPQFL